MPRIDLAPIRRAARFTPLLWLAFIVLIGVAIGALSLRPVPGSAAPDLDVQEQAFLQLINDYRADNGRGPLAGHPQLAAAADWMVFDMALCNYLSHTDSLGRLPNARVHAFGYPRGVGENAARGGIFPTAESVFNAWKGSSGHNANMLGSVYNVIGIGRTQGSNGAWYWVTDFGNASPPFPDPPADTGPAPGAGCSAPTPTAGPTSTPAVTPAPTATPVPTATPEPTPEPTPTPSPTPTSEPTPMKVSGDADCDALVESEDALLALRESAGYKVSAACLDQADVDCDGDRDSFDALAILRWVISLPLRLPPGCQPIGAAA